MSNRSRLATLPLGALRAFDAAARLGSFKAAAIDLAVTPAAVSHQIKALETHLGTSLFERLNRGLRLTTAGQRLAAVAADSFARLEAGLRDLDASGLTKGVATLTISSAPSIAAKWLVPRLHRFQAAHPQIELRLQSGDSLADVTAGGVDVALRYGTGGYGADATETQIWPKGEIVVVCAPSLAAAGGLRRPQDVLAHPLLRTAMPARRQNVTNGAADNCEVELGGWSSWLAAAGVEAVGIRPNTLRGPLFGSSHLAIDAAAAGRGLALAPRILVAADLAAGRLVEPFRIAVPDPFAYWLVHAARRADEPRISAFVRWVQEEAAAG
ncbi:LysR substrate-binding domain-containing protein [Dongia sp.]|uniref:LysR substrate-binding domain-containing protein n=1 Tax=Dongia sp. TaxID=1977262 RepID=UPI0035AF8FCC